MKLKGTETDNFGIKEIARLANVSIGTVDRVIHNRVGVSQKTKEKIERIIKELDYKPNIFARRLASRKLVQFATLIPKVSDETDFWEAPLKGIQQAEEEIKQNGINIRKYFFDLNDKQSFTEQSKLILKSKPDGILLAPTFIEESLLFIQSLKKNNIPYVFINSDIPDHDSLSYIGPDILRSGYMAGHLLNYLVNKGDKLLIVNISRGIEKRHELLRKEEGVRAYFMENNKAVDILKVDLKQTDYSSVARKLSEVLKKHPDIKAIFVTNSRVATVARYLERLNRAHIFLIGYDFIKNNLHFLDNRIIDFLICDKPREQGYKGIMALYNSIVFGSRVDPVNIMPIDIITKENYRFYVN